MRPHGTQIELERRRRRALEFLGNGMNPPEIAQKLGCSLSSVYYWNDLHTKKGDEALKPKLVPGRPEKLTQRQKRSLTGALLKGALKNGYSTDLWTLKRISDVTHKRFAPSKVNLTFGADVETTTSAANSRGSSTARLP